MEKPMVERVVVRRGRYFDPVTLMQVSGEVGAGVGVRHVAVGMADRLNLVVFGVRHGYDLGGADGLGPNDLVIAVRADSEAAAEGAVAAVEERLVGLRGCREVVGVGGFVYAGDVRGCRVGRVSWVSGRPVGADGLLGRLGPVGERIGLANDLAVARMQEARPLVVGVGVAGEVLPGMSRRTFLHAGPPVGWADMCGPMRGAVIGAALLEGLAADPEDAVRKAAGGAFEFASGHERGALGPMAGVISFSMPVWIVENDARGNRAHCTFSEGLGGPFRFGAFDEQVIDRLRWIRSTLAPVLTAALARLREPLDLRAICADALEMGDEVHNRNRAATSLTLRILAPVLLELSRFDRRVTEVARYLAGDDVFFLNLSMACGKATADAAAGVEGSTIVTTMARNGTEFGLRVSGCGDRWFTAPSSRIEGLYLPGYTAADANPDMGDSTITETIGLGGFAWAAAPAIIDTVGLGSEDAMRATLEMYEISWAESANYRIPALGFRGSPLGIDCRKVVDTGIAPVADSGIAHRESGVGIIGRGHVSPPIAPFEAALRMLSELDATS
jgi:uncharacterized protein DUF1116